MERREVESRNPGWLIALLIILAVIGLVPLLGGGMMGWGMMGPGMMGGWGAANPWWGITMLVVWIALIAGIVLLAVWGFRQIGPVGGVARQPLDILKERYARGEISREQFEQMRRDLEA